MPTPPPLLTYRDAALQLGVSYATVRRYAAQGLLPIVHVNGMTRRISQTALDDFIETRTVAAVR